MLQPIENHKASQALVWPSQLNGSAALAGLLFSEGQVENPQGAVARLEPGPSALMGLSHSQKGRAVRLVSAVDPVAEDRALIERFKFDPAQGVLCLGLGLAYHLDELAAILDPKVPLWVMESRPELAACALTARDLSHLFSRPGFRLFVGPFDQFPGAEQEDAPSQVLWRPATARYFASEYPLAPPVLAKRLAKPRLLIFQSGYFLDRELKNAAEDLGLTTAFWHFQRGAGTEKADYHRLLEQIKSFRPEMVLTVNHLGFDAEGVMDELFTSLGLPVASWFVDSPAFILGPNKPGPTLKAFSWDKDYLPWLKERGFSGVHYLPLATDERFFCSEDQPSNAERCLAFVGDSLTVATEKYLAKLGFKKSDHRVAGLLARADRLAEDFLKNPRLWPDEVCLRDLAQNFSLETEEEISLLAALVTWRASRLWRLQVLKVLPPADLTVAGDRNWASLLNPGPARLLPPLDYYRELPSFYRGSHVNINVTSAQMKTGLNQRVFDVPAAGGFLLTDYRAQLDELFKVGREVITYHEPEEARDLALWYASRQPAREKIVRAAQKRIRAGHLYSHRLREIVRLTRA